MIAGLIIILIFIFVLPFLLKKMEEELELFLFVIGLIAVSITYQWNLHLIRECLIEPIKITLVVFLAGILFELTQKSLDKNLNRIVEKLGLKLFVFLLVVVLGVFSGIITAVVAALILVEIISNLKLDKKIEIKIIVLTCFSIGLGAALTPIGEPFSTIVVAKLKGKPCFVDFWFLFKLLGIYIIPGIIMTGLVAAKFVKKGQGVRYGFKEKRAENFKDIIIRTLKIYLFIVALILLGTGFKPLVEMYISKTPPYVLYWANILSAILDNATMAAAEIGPALSLIQIKYAILGIIIAGGFLIPGNIPNIIVANKLKIKSKEWAKIGVPFGFALMIVYFIILTFIHYAGIANRLCHNELKIAFL
ncbi:MAG: DUF1646 family protein [Elusimicrobiota bacterium]